MKTPAMKTLRFTLLALLLTAASTSSHAFRPTPDEMASLPPYCPIRFGSSDTPAWQSWRSTLGPDFAHVHHYCAGLNFLTRYYKSRRPQDRAVNLKDAHGNFSYMLRHSKPGFSLLPDINLQMGNTLKLQGNPGAAITHYQKSIELDPRAPRAYNALASLYEDLGKSSDALAVVSAGLRHNPEATSLQKRYRALGGKLPYPEALPVAASADDAPATAATTTEPTATEPTTTEPTVSEPTATEATATKPVAAPPGVPVETKIGSPSNPYCRFCAD